MAADSQFTIGGRKETITSSDSFKIFQNGERVLMGLVGSLRDLNILSTSTTEFIDPYLILKEAVDFRSIVRETVPKIFDELGQFKRVTYENGVPYLDSDVLVAFDDQCYLIYHDGCVVPIDEMIGMGSGGSIAESAYSILKDTSLSPKEKAIKAVISSCEKDLYVNYPIVIRNTKTFDLEIFDGENFYILQGDSFVEVTDEEEVENVNSLEEGEENEEVSNGDGV